MENLSHVPGLEAEITRAPTKVIRVFHRFVFGEDGDRRNRKRLREFPGFTFAEDSDEFRAKVTSAAETFTVTDLSAICGVLRLDHAGSVEEIALRICRHLTNLELFNNMDNDSEDEDDDVDEDDDFDEEEIRNNAPRFTVSFRDVEDTIRPFNGGDGYPIEAWVEDFEDNAKLFNWSNLQKLLFANKLLTGLASLFIRGERGISSWEKLRSSLLNEFSSKMNSADLHEELRRRKLRRDESVQEYYLIMKELASRGKIEEKALVKYIVNGITDDASRTVVLYGARNLKELKEKLEIYDTIRREKTPSTTRIKMAPIGRGDFPADTAGKMVPTGRVHLPTGQPDVAVPRCYNCNEEGHIAAACPKPKRARGSCYLCGATDHQKRTCPRQARAAQARSSVPAGEASTHLVERTPGLPPSYTIEARLSIGCITAVLDAGLFPF